MLGALRHILAGLELPDLAFELPGKNSFLVCVLIACNVIELGPEAMVALFLCNFRQVTNSLLEGCIEVDVLLGVPCELGWMKLAGLVPETLGPVVVVVVLYLQVLVMQLTSRFAGLVVAALLLLQYAECALEIGVEVVAAHASAAICDRVGDLPRSILLRQGAALFND